MRTKMLTDASSKSLHGLIKENVEEGSAIYTDAWKGYNGLSPEFFHAFVDHAVRYAEGAVNTNGLENYFSLLKRTLRGTYVSVEPFHLTKYMDEQAFRFNNRKMDDSGSSLSSALSAESGLRMTSLPVHMPRIISKSCSKPKVRRGRRAK